MKNLFMLFIFILLCSCSKEESLLCDAVVGKSVFLNGIGHTPGISTHFFTLSTGKKVVVDLSTYNSIQSIKGDEYYCR